MTVPSAQQGRAEARQHRRFWEQYPGLIWSNTTAGDAACIRAALLMPRFEMLLDIALEFGLDRLKAEWRSLTDEGERETLLATPATERMLRNITEGFARAQA